MDVDSFFTYFKSKKAPEGLGDNDESDEDREKLIMAIEDDISISEEISREIIPRALYYYLDLVESSDDEDDEDGDDSDEHDHDHDDDDEEEEGKKKKKGGKKHKDSKDDGEGKSEPASKKECKQQ